MKFLYPGFLWALSAVLIPIIIHLFNFRRYKTIYFSNVAFLQNIRKETKSRSQIKNLLLLLIRMLAIVFLVMVFAQPYIVRNNKVLVKKQNIVAVYLDNSFSMDATGKYGIFLENAKMKAHEIANSYTYSTKFLLTTNNFDLKHQQLVSKDQFVDWVSQVKATHVIRTIEQVDKLQQNILGNLDSLSSIHQYILSDFQKTIFKMSHKIPTNINQQYLVNFENSSTNNIFIDSVWFESPGQYIGKQEKLMVSVWNKSDQEVNDLQINLFINDSLKSLANISILTNKRQIVELPFMQTKRGINNAKVELNDYPITFDNEFYFSYNLTSEINVLQIINGVNVNYLKALYNEDENFNYTEVEQDNIVYEELSKFHVIILNGLSDISSGLINVLSQKVKNGARLVIIPPMNCNVTHYQSLLKNIEGVSLGMWRAEKGYMQNIELEHQFFKESIKSVEGKINLPEYKGYYSAFMNTLSDAKVLLESEAGKPLIIQEESDKGDYILFTVPLNLENSTLATHPVFVPLFYNLALFSQKMGSLYYNLISNLSISLNGYNFSDVVKMKSLQDELEILPRVVYGNNNLTLFVDEQNVTAGYYSLNSDSNNGKTIAFNFSRQESYLDQYTESDLKDYAKNQKETLVNVINGNNKSMQAELVKNHRENNLSTLFLWLLAMFLIAEMLIVRFVE